ncbi:hypothetical protein PRIPAC_86815 [Pristionchus pacificus]|uniref:Uncharacterized protein n=1 Tax=Pristionchus pacificus TaxID=54126 RepID=A0A2A6BN06_PRIPA|nr:hypothetical protein PRIPAC_86815 [Pristionchus pacificus]|eukprot:PDM67151.1 hypothetical protein PRIPAC_48568 [Pristionchus pacificus]
MAQSLDHKNLDKCWKDYLVGWRDQGLSLEEMSLRCKAMGHTCSPSSIKRLLDLPLEIVKAPYSPQPSTIPPELYDDVRKTIIDLYQEDDEITMIRLLLKIEEKFKLQLSDYPIERIRKEAGFVSLNVRHGHSVKLVNRQPRVDWCRVLIWGGISWKGVTNLVVMSESCRVDAPEYCRILRDGYIKWESEKYGGKSLLVQDNARCHTAKITQDFLAREEIKV